MQVIEFSSDPKCSDRTCVWFLAPLRAGFAQKFFFGLAMSDVPAQPKIVGWQNLPDRALGMKTPAGAASALTSGTETALRGTSTRGSIAYLRTSRRFPHQPVITRRRGRASLQSYRRSGNKAAPRRLLSRHQRREHVGIRPAEIGDRHGSAEQIALREFDAGCAHIFELLFGLHALDGGDDTKALRKRQRGSHHSLAFVAGENVARERLVDLDLVEGEDCQIADRGEAGAEIVERDRKPEMLQSPDRGEVRFAVFQQRGLGDFELEACGREPRLEQRAEDGIEQIAVLELYGRDVDRDLDMRWPVDGIRAGALQDPFAERLDQADRKSTR